MSHGLSIAAAAGAALLLSTVAVPAQTSAPGAGESGAAASAARPPDVSRIVIRRPDSPVVRPEDYRNPVPVTETETGTGTPAGDEGAADGEAVDPEIAGNIVVRDAPESGAAVAPSVPNATSVDVNAPGVRIRLGR